MSEFGDISRMNLSELERKGQNPDREIDEELDEEIISGTEVSDEEDETGTELAAAGQEAAGQEADTEEVSVEVEDKKERMAAPNGRHYYIDAEITPKEMRSFLFAHNYRSPLMILATLVGLVWPVYTVLRSEGSLMVAIVCALVFLVLMPFSIWRRGTTSVTQNPIYQNTFHYMLDESGLHLELAEHAIDVDWSKVTKTMFLKSSAVIYTGKVNAYLIPTDAMGDRRDEIIAFIRNHC